MEHIRAMRTGAGPRWPVVIGPERPVFIGQVALGNGESYVMGICRDMNGHIFVGVRGKGAAVYEREVTQIGVVDTLNVRLIDGGCIADLINVQFGAAIDDEQGDYILKYCA